MSTGIYDPAIYDPAIYDTGSVVVVASLPRNSEATLEVPLTMTATVVTPDQVDD